jgi:hypothetical protein
VGAFRAILNQPHHLDQVSEAEFEAQVPPHAQHDDLAIEVATLKKLIQTWEPSHHPALYSADGGQDREASKLHHSQICRLISDQFSQRPMIFDADTCDMRVNEVNSGDLS